MFNIFYFFKIHQYVLYTIIFSFFRLIRLTNCLLEEFRLVFPGDEGEVDGYGGEYHQTAIS